FRSSVRNTYRAARVRGVGRSGSRDAFGPSPVPSADGPPPVAGVAPGRSMRAPSETSGFDPSAPDALGLVSSSSMPVAGSNPDATGPAGPAQVSRTGFAADRSLERNHG